MATLVLGALGTMVGGPLGGAVGALLGRQLDGGILGGNSREGPRLKDLSITTSTYGTPIVKHYGRMRASGTIIWATDLQESRETSGGGKGKPKTTNYSYSSSFAVSISSRPIKDIGRIWADGNLLRGAKGDLKAGGLLRIYNGYGDQNVDPLLSSALGAECPAYRHQAYVVFEDLQLEDFGNRIPALTFEVIGDDNDLALDEILGPLTPDVKSDLMLSGVSGFTYEGGSLLGTLGTIHSLFPIACDSSGDALSLSDISLAQTAPVLLPPAMSAWDENDFGQSSGYSRRRGTDIRNRPDAIRYYDTGRDYQIGVQRPDGRSQPTGSNSLEFPGALDAGAARTLINEAAARAKTAPNRMQWRIAELDPALVVGSLVQAPDVDGVWVITGWEWRERGVELELQRVQPKRSFLRSPMRSSDAGALPLPEDFAFGQSRLLAFELPWDGFGPSNISKVYVAASGENGAWRGASLYTESAGPTASGGGTLDAIGVSGRSQAVMGELATPLAPSAALVLEEYAYFDVRLVNRTMSFQSISKADLAQGGNKIMVGGEVLQFQNAEQLSDTDWRLSALLRGRAGTEGVAQAGHIAGAPIVLLDSALIDISEQIQTSPSDIRIAAIGRGDEEPVLAEIANRNISNRPLTPVHSRITALPNGGVQLCWTRRARGAWGWLDGVEIPLNEEAELYRIGIGPVESPLASWQVASPQIELALADYAAFAGQAVWVRQIGRSAQSAALHLMRIE